MSGLIDEARRDLRELIMIKKDVDKEFDEKHVPIVRIEKLEDDCSKDKVRWSFLNDTRN